MIRREPGNDDLIARLEQNALLQMLALGDVFVVELMDLARA